MIIIPHPATINTNKGLWLTGKSGVNSDALIQSKYKKWAEKIDPSIVESFLDPNTPLDPEWFRASVESFARKIFGDSSNNSTTIDEAQQLQRKIRQNSFPKNTNGNNSTSTNNFGVKRKRKPNSCIKLSTKQILQPDANGEMLRQQLRNCMRNTSTSQFGLASYLMKRCNLEITQKTVSSWFLYRMFDPYNTLITLFLVEWVLENRGMYTPVTKLEALQSELKQIVPTLGLANGGPLFTMSRGSGNVIVNEEDGDAKSERSVEEYYNEGEEEDNEYDTGDLYGNVNNHNNDDVEDEDDEGDDDGNEGDGGADTDTDRFYQLNGSDNISDGEEDLLEIQSMKESPVDLTSSKKEIIDLVESNDNPAKANSNVAHDLNNNRGEGKEKEEEEHSMTSYGSGNEIEEIDDIEEEEEEEKEKKEVVHEDTKEKGEDVQMKTEMQTGFNNEEESNGDKNQKDMSLGSLYEDSNEQEQENFWEVIQKKEPQAPLQRHKKLSSSSPEPFIPPGLGLGLGFAHNLLAPTRSSPVIDDTPNKKGSSFAPKLYKYNSNQDSGTNEAEVLELHDKIVKEMKRRSLSQEVIHMIYYSHFFFNFLCTH